MDCLFILVAVCTLGVSHAYPGGPPTSVCESMTPGHGYPIQVLTTNPYMIEVSSKCYKPGHEIEVKIYHQDKQTPFRGFFVQARYDNNKMCNGTFRQNEAGQKVFGCSNADNNAISHSSNMDKMKTEFKWIASSNSNNMMMDIHFRVTVVENKSKYWVGITSEKIMYKADCGGSTGPFPTPGMTGKGPANAYSVIAMMIALSFVKLFA